MLPSSAVRRVVPAAGALASSSAPQAAATPFLRGHQRRCSSSKPSKSDRGSSDGPPDGTGAQASKAGEKRKRKERDATNKLPSVANTHHMVGEALGLSSFFSLHRPLSVNQPMPRAVTSEQFAKIFATRSKPGKVHDTMSTITSTIDQLEGPMASMTIGRQDAHAVDGQQHLEVRNADGSEQSITLQVDAMSGDFLPFRPPPLPQPQQESLEADAAAAAELDVSDETPLHRSYKAMFTIEESTDADGQMRIMAHSPEIVQDRQPRSFLERMAQRQVKLDEARDMHAISVRRQRKLRMKKKKYKKLMKRTRNERRSLGRT